MNQYKRRHQSDSEDSDDEEQKNVYDDPIDYPFFSDTEIENDNRLDPLASVCDVEECFSGFDELSNEEESFDFFAIDEDEQFGNDEHNFDPLGSDESDFDDDEDFNFDVSSGDELASDTDTDTDTEENVAPRPKERDLKIKWKKVPDNFVPRKKILVHKVPEIRVEEDSTPVCLFFKMFPKSLMEWIAKCTNGRLDILAEKKGIEVEHTDSNEIILVIGCLLVMGYNHLPHIPMYWSNNPTLGNKAIKNAITRDRFLLLVSKLYFNHPIKPKGADRLYYLDKMAKCLKHTFKKVRSDSTFQSVDETMVKFKGRWAGKQYMPQKKIKRGGKIWTRSDAMTGYCYDFNIYKGKENVAAEGTLGERVVVKLCSTIGGEDVVICTDRFFTSYNLMKNLQFACVGTCMTNRKNVPVMNDKLKKGESVSQSTADGVIGFKWQDTKEVLLLSNCHGNDITTVERRQKDGSKKTVPCPEAISFYNKYMGGVDMTDQYTVLYDIDRKSTKWWKRVFQRLLMTAVTNAWVIYKQLKNKKIPLIDMLIPLAENLIEIGRAGSRIQRNSQNGRPSKKAKMFVNAQHLPIPSTKRRCSLCSSKNMQKRTKFVCSTCDIPLCAGCFLPYHK